MNLEEENVVKQPIKRKAVTTAIEITEQTGVSKQWKGKVNKNSPISKAKNSGKSKVVTKAGQNKMGFPVLIKERQSKDNSNQTAYGHLYDKWQRSKKVSDNSKNLNNNMNATILSNKTPVTSNEDINHISPIAGSSRQVDPEGAAVDAVTHHDGVILAVQASEDDFSESESER